MQISSSDIPISTSNVEIYKHETNLWNDFGEEFENESGAYLYKPDQREESGSLKSQALEDESKSINYQEQDVDL